MNGRPTFADAANLEPRREGEVRCPKDATPLEFLQAVYCNESLPLQARLKAAVEAAQYVHPRLAVTGIVEGQNIAALLEARLARIKKGEIGLNRPAVIDAVPQNQSRAEPNRSA